MVILLQPCMQEYTLPPASCLGLTIRRIVYVCVCFRHTPDFFYVFLSEFGATNRSFALPDDGLLIHVLTSDPPGEQTQARGENKWVAGGGRSHLLLTFFVIRPLTTHPFRDGAWGSGKSGRLKYENPGLWSSRAVTKTARAKRQLKSKRRNTPHTKRAPNVGRSRSKETSSKRRMTQPAPVDAYHTDGVVQSSVHFVTMAHHGPWSLLRGAIVNRTYGTYKNLYISPFLLTRYGHIYYAPP